LFQRPVFYNVIPTNLIFFTAPVSWPSLFYLSVLFSLSPLNNKNLDLLTLNFRIPFLTIYYTICADYLI